MIGVGSDCQPHDQASRPIDLLGAYAGRAQGTEPRVAVPLRQPPAVGADDQRDVGELPAASARAPDRGAVAAASRKPGRRRERRR